MVSQNLRVLLGLTLLLISSGCGDKASETRKPPTRAELQDAMDAAIQLEKQGALLFNGVGQRWRPPEESSQAYRPVYAVAELHIGAPSSGNSKSSSKLSSDSVEFK